MPDGPARYRSADEDSARWLGFPFRRGDIWHAWLMDELRWVYVQAATTATSLLGEEAVAEQWNESSVLDKLTVGELAAHLARSVLQVEAFLDGPVGEGELVAAVQYYARLTETNSSRSALNEGVRARSRETAAQGAAAVAADSAECLQRLRTRLPNEPAQQRVAVLHRPGEQLLLDEYLATRCVELAVHTEDLALSVDAQVEPPSAAVSVAVDTLIAAGRQRHGDRQILRALARRERDEAEALRVL